MTANIISLISVINLNYGVLFAFSFALFFGYKVRVSTVKNSSFVFLSNFIPSMQFMNGYLFLRYTLSMLYDLFEFFFKKMKKNLESLVFCIILAL